ncbi:hypothetical protein HNQ03_002355 [Chryseobacterium sp. 16F]|uniref:Uncharacterized protein n=1 Tax=Frigoriflavimonas asaccharolytica TaxID=2735899 RepID=A0A8J8G883_9FLAO|nr:hypothetical protein [Frigoriflavimonas asaccharolytica]
MAFIVVRKVAEGKENLTLAKVNQVLLNLPVN